MKFIKHYLPDRTTRKALNRRIDTETESEYTKILAQPPNRFEVFMSDGSMVSGKSNEDWDALPNDIQIVIWELRDGSQYVIHGMEEYRIGRKRAKTGPWIEDERFDEMSRVAPWRSDIMGYKTQEHLQTKQQKKKQKGSVSPTVKTK